MTKEQAVNLLDDLSEYGLCYNITEEYQEAMKLVLSMLEEKNNRINQLENMNKFQSKDIKEAVDYIFELNKEIEFRDKQIDLMSETINNHDIDKDICKQMGQKEDCNEFEDKERCKDCIKHYFKNKTKEVQ